MKETEDKEGDKALGNEQGLKCHKLEARQRSELGCLWHSLPLVSKSVDVLTVAREAL